MSVRLVARSSQELVDAARSFHEELRLLGERELDKRIEEIASAYMLRGHCKAGHPMTLANTQSIGKAGYRCRECRRKIARESARRKSAKARGEQA